MNAEALIGRVLGTCTLEKLIGQGGMGAVYLAQQSRPRRQVAVKVLLPMTSNANQHAAFLERFRRETDAAASLEHPNIVPVHEYGERDGLAYLVMPYISGGTLRDELEHEGSFPLTKVVNYLDQLVAALDAAHARGVVHRDVKPANILKTPDGRLVLTDFGLVKIATEGTSQQMHLTGAGVPLGTPDYMAPEQVIGGEVDARADIYSLGVILYQMVTGMPPFRGEMPMQVAMQHLQMPPQSPRTLRPDLPLTAEQVMLRALAKRPADRYVHAQDLASAFRLALNVAGVQLDTSTGLMPAIHINSTDGRFFVPRARGLFDPMWQASKAQAGENGQQAVAGGLPRRANQPGGRNDIVSKTSMPLPSLSGLLPPAASPSASPGGANDLYPQAFSPPSAVDMGGDTPLPPTRSAPVAPARPRPPQRPGLLRSMTAFNGFAEVVDNPPLSSTPTTMGPSTMDGTNMPMVPTTPSSSRSSAMQNMPEALSSSADEVNQLSFSGNWLDSLASAPIAPEAAPELQGRSQTRQLDPISPLPPMSTTGSVAAPYEVSSNTGAMLVRTGEPAGQGTTSMVKLTQPVKVVKVPIAGQPGRYVTGFLPVLTDTSDGPNSADSSNGGMLPSTPFTLPPSVKRVADAMHIAPEKQMQTFVLVVAALIILLASSAFWLFRSHAGPSTSRGNTTSVTTIAPDLAATASSRATATAQANIILVDPLRDTTHSWPLFTKGPQISVFKDGAYHITDNDTKNSATALLPGIILKDCTYTLTAREVQGDDTSINNEFGLLMRYGTFQKNGQTYTTFYAFEVTNMAGGQYQFLKYDDSSDGSPWTSIWSNNFAKEFHSGHGQNAQNVFKVIMKGAKFTFFINGKQVGTASDGGIKSGQVGMLVNLQGTEVAFSNLVLTYN